MNPNWGTPDRDTADVVIDLLNRWTPNGAYQRGLRGHGALASTDSSENSTDAGAVTIATSQAGTVRLDGRAPVVIDTAAAEHHR